LHSAARLAAYGLLPATILVCIGPAHEATKTIREFKGK
jgi:hypothetical protein